MGHMHKTELLFISSSVKCHHPPKVPDEKQDTVYKPNRKHSQVAAEKTEAEGQGHE